MHTRSNHSKVYTMNQAQKAKQFRALHHENILVLPNAWDASSAKIIEMAGAQAIATTSAGIAWSKGKQDGQVLHRTSMISVLREIVSTIHLPVTADIESGYGVGDIEDVAVSVSAVLEAGAIGINLEDTPGRENAPVLTPAQQAKRISKARETANAMGIELFINARTDIYLAGIGDPKTRFDAVVQRAAVYIEAGADGIFVPGLVNLSVIHALAKAINAPLNIMAGPGAPSVQALQKAGVSRVSTGPALALAALDLVHTTAKEVVNAGTFDALASRLTFSEINDAFANGNNG